jgi:hypothetical protein
MDLLFHLQSALWASKKVRCCLQDYTLVHYDVNAWEGKAYYVSGLAGCSGACFTMPAKNACDCPDLSICCEMSSFLARCGAYDMA